MNPDVSLEILEILVPHVVDGRAIGAEIAARPRSARPDGIFASNDVVAMGVLQGFAASGEEIVVPDDIAVIGYDDIDFAENAVVPLSSIRHPAGLIGSTAVDILLKESADPERGPAAGRLRARAGRAGIDPDRGTRPGLPSVPHSPGDESSPSSKDPCREHQRTPPAQAAPQDAHRPRRRRPRRVLAAVPAAAAAAPGVHGLCRRALRGDGWRGHRRRVRVRCAGGGGRGREASTRRLRSHRHVHHDVPDVIHGAADRAAGRCAGARDRSSADDEDGSRGVRHREWLAYCGQCSIPEIGNVFRRAGIPFRSVSGWLRQDARVGAHRPLGAGGRHPRDPAATRGTG